MNANMTAAQIFDTTTAAGTPASDNIFQTVYSLAQALSSDDDAGIQTAANSLKAGTSHLTQVSVFYGSVESWIDQASTAASDQLATLQQSLSSVKEVDMPTAITSLTSDQVALQASLSAHASLPTKTLFDYLG